jgi:lipopolysaccharide export system protein LptA
MPLPVYHLRRLLVLITVVFVALVTGMYFYARSRTRNVLKDVPNKLGYDIKQTANGFQFSKSDGKRTLFTVQASKVKEFKVNGRAELHDVNIVLYGRDSSRFDQIYGDDFAFDPATGNVTAQGDVQIDLVDNPSGLTRPDQAPPKELKNPIHLKTRDLVFNRETGNAWTDAPVEFRTPQAEGTAVGVKYSGKTNVLTLASKIHVELNDPHAAVIDAASGLVTNDPHQITLEHPRLQRESGSVQADHAVFYLSSDDHVERVSATGNVSTVARLIPRKKRNKVAVEASEIHGHADEAEFLLEDKRDELRTATLSGNVHFDDAGPQPMVGDAGRVILNFAEGNQLEKVHAVDGAHLVQKAPQSQPGTTTNAQDFDLRAPAIDFTVADGRTLDRVTTSGAPQITITPSQPSSDVASSEKTIVTAAKFEGQFTKADGRSYLSAMHGTPDARIVNSTPGHPDRVSTSDVIDATFAPHGGLESLIQQGNFVYTDNLSPEKRTQAWARTARYTPVDHVIVLEGEPRVDNHGVLTTAKTIRINRSTGDATAEGQVKSTYSDLKEQPNGALLASSSPIHVTARTMTAHNTPGVALYSGNARLWQDANVIEAQSIQFDRDRRFVIAQGTPEQPVLTLLADTQKKQSQNPQPQINRKPKVIPGTPSAPITITAAKLTYADSERKIHYEGDVIAKSIDFTATAKAADAYLLPHSQGSKAQATPGQLDHMVAEGDVVIQEPKRRAEGQKLVYTADEDKFVLTGGPPSIFDAEQGKITGVSLTFFRRDDRVLVEGEAGSSVVTTTRVAQ